MNVWNVASTTFFRLFDDDTESKKNKHLEREISGVQATYIYL